MEVDLIEIDESIQTHLYEMKYSYTVKADFWGIRSFSRCRPARQEGEWVFYAGEEEQNAP